MLKKWERSAKMDDGFAKQFPEIHPVVLQLLFNRGLTEEQDINNFLYPEFDKNLHDPYIFKNMIKSCDRIIDAVQSGQKILVYGDYDADGVSSSVLLVSALQALGGKVGIYIPHREVEGYGLSKKGIAHIIEEKYNLVITVDCAISNKDEVAEIQSHGIDVIVTDHHAEPLEVPEAYALINPQLSSEDYPFKKLAGVGVAFKVVQGLFKRLNEKNLLLNQEYFDEFGGYEGYEKWLLDLVSIGTVADCMPLLDENRVFVKYGLVVLRKTKRTGLRELITHSGINIADLQTYHIGFQIAPRINAAGRLDHANVAYELLMSDKSEHACELSIALNETNTERQKMTELIMKEARLAADKIETKNLVIALGDEWLGGIVGLVAGRLVDRFNKPVFVLTKSKGNISGSGRSLPAFNMIEALQKLDDYLQAYGGHKLACGFTIKDNEMFDEFVQKIDKIAGEQMAGKDLTPIINVDTEMSLADCNWELVEQLELFEPFGYGNSEPIFMAKGLHVKDCAVIGRDDKHMRFSFEQDGVIRKAVAFGFGKVWSGQIRVGDTVDVVCNVGTNEWNGNREIQLKLVDMKFSTEG